MTRRPESTEYAPYYGKYVMLVPDGDLAATLSRQVHATLELLSPLSEQRAGFSYAPGKWSIKEVVGHLIDGERVFAYRALRIGRNDKTPLPGFEQDDYVASANFNERTLSSLLEEFTAVRQATVQLFKNFAEKEWQRRGTANGQEITPLSLGYIVAGHELHHMDVLRTRYLSRGAAAESSHG
jgi:DinB superfamily